MGLTAEEIEEAVSGVAKGNPVNTWDSVVRFYTATCEVRVDRVMGTIVTVINKDTPLVIGRKMMKTTIISSSDPAGVEVCLSDAPIQYEFTGDVIAPVNRLGNWIEGLELLRSPGLSLERALAPFDPKPRAPSVRHEELS